LFQNNPPNFPLRVPPLADEKRPRKESSAVPLDLFFFIQGSFFLETSYRSLLSAQSGPRGRYPILRQSLSLGPLSQAFFSTYNPPPPFTESTMIVLFASFFSPFLKICSLFVHFLRVPLSPFTILLHRLDGYPEPDPPPTSPRINQHSAGLPWLGNNYPPILTPPSSLLPLFFSFFSKGDFALLCLFRPPQPLFRSLEHESPRPPIDGCPPLLSLNSPPQFSL